METTLPSHLPLPLARHAKALLDRKKQLEKENALTFFQPHPKQLLFFLHAFLHFRYGRTGNRFGKSEMGSAEDIAFARGERSWIPKGLTFRNSFTQEKLVEMDIPAALWDEELRYLGIPKHATKGLIITTDWDKSTEVFTETEGDKQGKLIKYIPKDALVSMTKNHSGAIDRIIVRSIHGGNSIIRLDTVKSFKQNPAGQESGDNDWIHIDEPIPEAMWKAVSRGLVDRQGRAWFTCTPLSEPWIDKKFIPDVEDQISETLPTLLDNAKSTFLMTGTMDDNPHNSPEAIARFMADLTPEEQDARRRGIPLSYSGLVYDEFIYNIHVRKEPPKGWKDWNSPPADHCIYGSIDYHFKKPNAIPFMAVPPDGPVVVFAEIFSKMLLADEVARINDILGGRPYQPFTVDPLASTPNKVNDLTAMDEYRIAGLAVFPATKDPVNGIRAVKALLKGRDKNGGPLVIINKACVRFVFEIARGFVMDESNNKPVKENDDMMEAFYRLVLNGLRYIEPTQDSDYNTIQPREIPSNVLDFSFGSPLDEPAKVSNSHRYRGGTEKVFFSDEAVL